MTREAATKTAVLVLSDPNGGDEALGRVFNALAAAYDFDQAGDEVRVQFHGAGTRWPELLSSPEHPAYDVYQAVRHTVAGASCGCSDVFGSSESIQASGIDLIKDNPLPGTSGLASLRTLVDDGYAILSF
ncbi:DsrE family protein [Nocardia cyriacigeorgica]|uniref:DsrE family protein n=1 Tax=Nocardia cyriacigeorgica TaxID=135487 RepID=UPI002453CE2D|nr:DsrE family protein [Nocardia cyriacigeorgica]